MEIDLVYFISQKTIKIFKSNINNCKVIYDKKNFSVKKNKLKRKENIYNYVSIKLKIYENFPIGLFKNCQNLVMVSFKKNQIKNPIDFSYAFNNCINLKEFNILDVNFNNVTSTRYMFYSCEKLKKIDLRNLSLENTVSADSMFEFCYNLGSIKLCDIPGKKMISAQRMFSSTSIEKADFSFLNEKIKDISDMFSFCSNLKKVNLLFLSNETNIEDVSFCSSPIVLIKRSIIKKLDNYVKSALIEI